MAAEFKSCGRKRTARGAMDGIRARCVRKRSEQDEARRQSPEHHGGPLPPDVVKSWR